MSAEYNTCAVGYLRVATGSARKREMSVYLQRQAIFGYAKMTDIKIVRFFADHACVLEIEMCQGLSDALEYIVRGKASALMVAGLTRLTISSRICGASSRSIGSYKMGRRLLR